MRALIKVGLGMLLLAFVLIGVAWAMLRSQGLSSPSSPAARAVRGESRPVSAEVRVVELNGPLDLTLRQGDKASLKVRGEQRLLGNIATTQEGKVLHIGPAGMLYHHKNPLQVELVLPALELLDVHGSGDSTVRGFSGEAIEVHMEGSGNVDFRGGYRHVKAALSGSGALALDGGRSEGVQLELVGSGQLSASGAATTLGIKLTGSGDLDTRRLAARRVKVVLTGSGSADLSASEDVDVVLRGSGDVRVSGAPQRRQVDRSGSGAVNWD